jgi:hypothetical protein
MTNFNLDILLSESFGGYRWYVYNTHDGHVMAQGFMRSFKRAQTAATNARADFLHELLDVFA